MQFKYPEILYALFLLLIPIFIHLFQLRRFEKVAFTNVDFLKKVELQTRKSAKLKKFLILLSRLGLFTAVILAFAQPYFSKNEQNLKPNILLYLDNSYSMQAKNGTNELLTNAVQNIISSFGNNSKVSIITNNDGFNDLTNKDIKNTLLSVAFTPISKSINTVLLEANNQFKKNKSQANHLILVSDFQSKNVQDELLIDKKNNYSFVQLKPQMPKNISVDSVFIEQQNGLDIKLKVLLRSYNTINENLSVSLFNDKILVGKASCSLLENKVSSVTFKIPFNDSFNGRLVIEDNFLPFDNELFFSLNKVEKINVLAIGEDNQFLHKIYTINEFNLISNTLNQVDYNTIMNQHIIVLNELESIPLSLQTKLDDFLKAGGSLVVIPALDIDLANYNTFFNSIKVGAISQKINRNQSINKIQFSHPILNGVFEKKIKNFQFPTIKSSYLTNLKRQQPILVLENNEAFISELKLPKGKVYWFASSLNRTNTNFKASPLIVPVFYNFAKQSYQLTSLYYTIGKKNKIALKTAITNDEVLQVQSTTTKKKFIPIQQVYQQKVVLTLDDNPLKDGFYEVLKKDQVLKNIAFNYDRDESRTQYANIKELIKGNDKIKYATNISNALDAIKNEYQVQSYWKWFVLLSILFLIIEVLFIKFLKN